MLKTTEIQNLLTQTGDQVLSLYLNVNPAAPENQADKPAWRIWLKNAMRDLPQQSDGDNKAWQQVKEQAETFIDTYKPGGRGLVLFFDADGYEYIQELPMSVKNQAFFGRPSVAQLAWLIDEYERYLIVLVDREKAYFMQTYLGNMGEQTEMTIDVDEYDFREKPMMPRSSLGSESATTDVGGGQTHGSHQDAHEDRIQAHVDRFYRDVAEKITEMLNQNDGERIVLGGNDKAAHAVRDELNQRVSARVVDIVALPMNSTDETIFLTVMPAALKYERAYEQQLLDEVIGLAKAGGRAILGHDDVLKALDQQLVELLIAPYPLPEEDQFNLLAQKAFAAGVGMEFVHDTVRQTLMENGGLAARLYYAIPEGMR